MTIRIAVDVGGGDGVVLSDERSPDGELGEDPGCDDAEVGESGTASELLVVGVGGLVGLGGLVSHGSPIEVADVFDGTEDHPDGSWPPRPSC